MNSSKKGFTYIEVILTLVIVAAVIIPFEIFSQFLWKNQKQRIHYGILILWKRKWKSCVWSHLRSLRMITYLCKPSDGTDGIYSGNHTGHFFKMRTDRNYFEENFSDIFITEKDMPRLAMARFKKAYRIITVFLMSFTRSLTRFFVALYD